MIKPDTLWNLFKNVKSPMTLGRICFSLAGRDDALDTPLNEFECTMADMVREAEEWMDEAIDAVKGSKRFYYLLKKKEKGTASEDELDELDKLESKKSKRSKRVLDTPPSVRPSVHPSVQKNKEDIKSLSPLPPAGGCCGENGEEVCRFSMDRIITACLQAHLFATRADAEKFGKYVYDNALLESCERNGSPVGLIKSIYNRWKGEGLDRTDLHRLTEVELAEVCGRVNEDIKGDKILPSDRFVFWNWLVGIDFKTTKGELVTAYNVRKLLSWWLESKYNLKEEHEKAAKAYREPVRDWTPPPYDPDLPPNMYLD